MNCAELQRSLAEAEGGTTAEQQAHLKTCARCSALLADLNMIASAAMDLRAIDDPSPRVWNSIEIALRQEGLIHGPRTGRSLIPSLGSPWGWARWMAPAAAALLFVAGIYLRQQSISKQTLADNIAQPAITEPVSDLAVAGLNDEDLLQEVAQQTPALQAQYADDLRRVNEYIQDAKGIVLASPNDEEARRALAEAYQQKAMLFELALDRSLP
ncbi:MAG TPA: hypothetical protein VMR80_00725 [Candidatus Acidoferrum sp.]|nr:hypothetical protein [Candidatus Acidoferrum sp.]